MKQDVPFPLDGHIQHHTTVQGVLSPGDLYQLIQFGAFQFRHKTHGADIDTQNRDILPGGRFRHVQNGTVAAKADDHFRIGQLPVQPGKPQISGQVIGAIHLKGQAQASADSRVLQNTHGFPNRLKILVPVGIGSKDHIFHVYSPLSSAA